MLLAFDPLNKDDVVSNTYRCHATYIAKGGDLNEVMAELYGKATGCAGGKQVPCISSISNAASWELQLLLVRRSSCNGICACHANGSSHHRKQRVVVSVFGDGATEEGCFHESLNLPLCVNFHLFVCEIIVLPFHQLKTLGDRKALRACCHL